MRPAIGEGRIALRVETVIELRVAGSSMRNHLTSFVPEEIAPAHGDPCTAGPSNLLLARTSEPHTPSVNLSQALRPSSAPHRDVEECCDQQDQQKQNRRAEEHPREAVAQALAPPNANSVMPKGVHFDEDYSLLQTVAGPRSQEWVARPRNR
jgi:hypothetical protein